MSGDPANQPSEAPGGCDDLAYCDHCQNMGTVECYCGGDMCVCGDEEIPCPSCPRGDW